MNWPFFLVKYMYIVYSSRAFFIGHASYTRIEVGDGSNILFWMDLWIGNGSLKDTYSEILRFATDSDAFVSDYVKWVNGTLQWKPLFNCEAQDWELESLDHFFSDLYAVKITPSGSDCLAWLPSPTKGFQVRSFYRVCLAPSYLAFC